MDFFNRIKEFFSRAKTVATNGLAIVSSNVRRAVKHSLDVDRKISKLENEIQRLIDKRTHLDNIRQEKIDRLKGLKENREASLNSFNAITINDVELSQEVEKDKLQLTKEIQRLADELLLARKSDPRIEVLSKQIEDREKIVNQLKYATSQ